MNLNFDKDIERAINKLPEFAANLIKKHEKEVAALVKEQITSGFRGDGQRTKKYESNPYIKQQQKQSAKSFPYRNYYVNGDFQNDIFVQQNGDDVFIGSSHRLTKYIEPQEEELFNLVKTSQDEVSNLISKELIQIVGDEIGKG